MSDEELAATIRALSTEAQIAAATAKVEALEGDAARYRWLRDNDGKGAVDEHIQAMWANCRAAYPSPQEWDAAIDAAMAAAQDGEVGNA